MLSSAGLEHLFCWIRVHHLPTIFLMEMILQLSFFGDLGQFITK